MIMANINQIRPRRIADDSTNTVEHAPANHQSIEPNINIDNGIVPNSVIATILCL